MNRFRVHKRAVATHVATALISALCVVIAGTTYLDTRINRAFDALCGILVVSTEPYPQPPQAPNAPAPTSDFGKALAKYNAEVAKRQRQGLAALNEAVDRYNCED